MKQETISKAKAAQLFAENAVLFGRADGVPEQAATELFGFAAVDFAKRQQSDRLDYDTSVELMERVMNAFPIQPEEREKVSRLDRIIYAVRGAYIFGYMSAVDTLNDAMRAFVADFIGGGGGGTQ